MDIVPGSFDGKPVTAQTFHDLDSMLQRFAAAGMHNLGDFQAFRTPEGRLVAIDPGYMVRLVGQSAHTKPGQGNTDHAYARYGLLKDAEANVGIKYLTELRAADPAAWKALMEKMQDASRREKGCIRYGFFAAVEDPLGFIAVEEWADRETLDRHFAKPHLLEFASALLELVSEPPEVAIHEVAETSAFLTAATGKPPPYRAAVALHNRTGGNPFFLEELLRAGEDLEKLGEEPLPWSLAETLRRQVDHLDPDQQRIVEAAAMLGYRIPFDLLAAVTGRAEDDWLAASAELEAAKRRLDAHKRDGDG